MRNVYIYDAIRTPRAKAKESGGLHDLLPHDLLKVQYESLVERTGLDPALVGDVLLGCVTQHGEQAGNIAKSSAAYAGWPSSVGGLTVNRFCSSSVDAMGMGMLRIAAGQEDAIVTAHQRRTTVGRSVKRRIAELKQQPLLRVHRARLRRRNPK